MVEDKNVNARFFIKFNQTASKPFRFAPANGRRYPRR
jgi:hypothetical protein